MEQLAGVAADSLSARLALARVPVRTEGNAVVLDLGSSDGIRNWSTVTLTGPGPAWVGSVKELATHRVTLDAQDPEAPLPEDGSLARVRLELRKIAVFPVAPGPLGGTATAGLEDALGGRLRERAGLSVIFTPDFPDSVEARAVAADAGAELLARGRADVADGRLRLRITIEPTIRSSGPSIAPLVVDLPIAETDRTSLASGGTFLVAPPGCRFESSRDSVPGALLELFPNRYRAGQLLALFPDRIEAWIFEPNSVMRTARYDLGDVWPAVVPTRWPVATVLPVNSVYGRDRQETKVFYAACSNQRPRFLTIESDRERPDSLWFTVSREPRDSLTSSFDSCFQRTDRVNRPRDYRLPEGMPETATTRLTLNEVVMGPAGVPVPGDNGRPRTRRVGVVYYDEDSATLWVSEADTAYRVPGAFGNEMDAYRAGSTGPPGLLVTGATAPGRDHLELWTLDGRVLRKTWQSDEIPGSITALAAQDLDGDHRDDIVFGSVRRGDAGPTKGAFLTRLYVMTSRPEPERPS